MSVKHVCIFILTFFIVVQASLAQSIGNDTLISTGQLKHVTKAESMQNALIFSAEEIQHLNAQNLNDVLKFIINALPVYIGTDGYNLDYIGNGRKSVLVLMNGLPIWQTSMVQVDMSRWPIFDVERIEVVYGNSSILYGSNANVAVINIISKWRKNKIAETYANVNFSGKNEYNVRFKNYFNVGRHGISFGAGRYYFDGFQGTDSGRVYQWKPSLTYTGNMRYSYALMHDVKAFVDVNVANTTILDRDYAIPNSNRVYDNEQHTKNLVIHAGILGKVSKYHTLDFTHAYSRYNLENQKTIKILTDLSYQPDPNILPYDHLTYDSYFSQFKIARNNEKSTIDYESGIEFNHQRDLQQSVLKAVKTNMTQISILGNVTYKPSELFWLKGGLRYTNSNKFSTPLLYSLQFKYQMNEQVWLYAQYARGYRNPSFNELFYTYENPQLNILGNLTLQSETYNQFNTTLKIESDDAMVLTNMFWQNSTNGIQLVAVDSNEQIYQFVNTKSSKFIGQSLTVQTRNKYLNARFTLVNNGINQYPEEIGSYYFFQEFAARVMLKIPKEHITLMYTAKYNGNRSEIRKNALGELEDFSQTGFWMMNASLKAEFGKNIIISFGVMNLSDVLNLNGKFQPIERLSDDEINSKIPLSIDFGRRGWLSITANF